ncbi:MAG TPA: prepilin peptidase [Jatrophihabitans sp.]|jgi:leader peptidase (prepilin peptidase)/N-methyltransferase|nr:prepilin peptidase [Jatrophihabitans sp.]
MTAAAAVSAVAAGVLGLAVGSFLNVVIYRVPAGLSVVSPPSACPNCGHAIRNRHNVPVAGWLLLRGRCYDCGSPISARYPAVEAVTGVLSAGLTLRLFDRPALGPALVAAATAVVATMISLDRHRLPAGISAVAGALAVVAAIAAAAAYADWPALLRGAVGAAVTGAAALAVAGGHPWSRRDAVPYAALLVGVAAYRSWLAAAIVVAALAVAAAVLLGTSRRRWFVAALGPITLAVLFAVG